MSQAASNAETAAPAPHPSASKAPSSASFIPPARPLAPANAVLVAFVAIFLGCATWTWLFARPHRQGPGDLDLSRRIDINAASQAELDLLPSVGPALSERIIERRVRVGPFKQVDDLLEIKGIGPATLERLRPFVVCGPGVVPGK